MGLPDPGQHREDDAACARAARCRGAAVDDDDDRGATVDPALFRDADDQYPGGWRSFPQEWHSAEGSVLAGEVRTHLRAAIDALPDRKRIVITLRDVMGHSSDEVCEMLEISAANQRVLLHRARAAVRGPARAATSRRTAPPLPRGRPEMSDLTCQEFVELVTEYFEGALDEDVEASFDRHRALCAGCETYLLQMRETVSRLGEIPVETLSDEMQSILLSAFREMRR